MSERDERVGELIDGRYKMVELIGAGGMGSVYRAEHVHLRREVAVKLLHPTLGRVSQIAERFAREAVAVARLQHDNCVAVQDFGNLDDGTLFLVMELVDGTTLDEMFEPDQPLGWRRAVRIGRHVLAGLAHAHDQGVVHRDVKPENIVVAPRGDDPDFAKLLDFGIAKMVGPPDRDAPGKELTEAGTAFGTPTYMAPEQAVGDPVDARTDLYQLSVVLYELIAGRPPFKAENHLETVQLHISRAVPPLPPGAAPPAVEAAILRGLAKRRDDRWPSANAYRDALEAAMRAPSATTPVSFPRPPRSRARWWWAGGAGAVAALIALAASGGSSDKTKTPLAGIAAPIARPEIEEFLAAHGGGDTTDGKLVELASTAGKREVRQRARELAERAGLGGSIDYVESYRRDLDQEPTCEARRAVVEKLRKLGNPAAIPVLKKARHRTRGGSRFDKTNVNACLKGDAEAAIAELEGKR